jgi:hypothetical protein
MAQAKGQKNSTMSDREFYFLMGVVDLILLIFYLTKHEERILFFSIYQHFDKIGMGLYGLFALGIFLLKEKMKKNLPKDRVYHLSKVWSDETGTFIATTKDGTSIHLPDKMRTGHVQIIGATGRGKTESVILPMMVRDLRRGKSSVLIDGKGDVELAERIKKQAPHVEVITFNLGNLVNSAITNPLKVGTSQQITDRIFAAFDFKDEYYRNTQYEITSALVALIREQKEEVTFKKLYDLFTSDELLSEAISKCQDEVL